MTLTYTLCIGTGEGRIQERNGGLGKRGQGEEDVQPGLPAHGANVAAGPQQNGVHPHRLRRPEGNHVQPPPSPPVHLQPRPGEHAARRRFPPVRQGPVPVSAAQFTVPSFAPPRADLSASSLAIVY